MTALSPVVRARGGLWVGWPGAPSVGSKELRQALGAQPTKELSRLHPVEMSEREHDRFYHGFSNAVLWPLFHGFQDRCAPAPGQWHAYVEVNRRFGRTLADLARQDDLIWVHDYHLMMVARMLRERGVRNRLGFYLHIPFPRPELLSTLPQHQALLRALLDFDLVGFQSVGDRDNFVEAARQLAGADEIALAPTTGPTLATPALTASNGTGARVRAGAFPISIDFAEFAHGSRHPDVLLREKEIRARTGSRTLLLGVDRLDYTKGIPERLHALDRALEDHPELRDEVVLQQLVMPSREGVPAYDRTKKRIDQLVAAINTRWATDEWTPIQYRYGTWTREELLAQYRAADVALVTPLNDGMNLVAKEYCAANGGTGVLILSAFAGAAAELSCGALLVNPSDLTSVATAIRAAHVMGRRERMGRMTAMRRQVCRNHVHRWVDSFLRSAF